MSLENSLERIATALEAIASRSALALEKKADAPPPPEKKADVPPPPPPVEKKADAPPPPPPPPPPASDVPDIDSADACNAELVKEYERLGANDAVMTRILGVMEANYKVRSVKHLTKEQFGPLIAAVRELK